jgi:glycosyltransferase involved in cell wall biosynthesis
MQNHNVLVTVIIPVFNRFDEAKRAIDSVIQQTHLSWEMIIVDDNSQPPFVLPISDNRINDKIILLRNNQNQGPGLSRQRALDLAKGSFVCFLDSDDYYHPEFLSKSLQMHLLNPGIAATYSTAIYIQTGQIREGSDHAYYNIMPALFEQRRPWPTCSLLWNKVSIATWKPLRTNQDSLFELDCSFINNNIRHIPEVLCYIDKGTGNNTADLVKAKASDRHRNEVALYALKNRHQIKVGYSEQAQLDLAIRDRVLYVSSKLAGHGYGLDVMKNGLKLMSLSWRAGFLLFLLGIPLLLKSRVIRRVVNKIITGIAKQK